jgi:hypothetical protein
MIIELRHLTGDGTTQNNTIIESNALHYRCGSRSQAVAQRLEIAFRDSSRARCRESKQVSLGLI